mgnify:FL=1
MIFSTKWYLNNSICELVPKKHGDNRGYLSETFKVNFLESINITDKFVQDNHSLSKEKFTFS